MSEIIKYLTKVESIMASVGGASLYGLIRTHGKHFKPAHTPEGVRRGTPKECFRNAAQLALVDSEELTYVEGYAVVASLGFPIHHGWVVTKDGTVIDNTWSTPGVEYYGIPFSSEYLMHAMSESGTYGILFNHHWRDILTDEPSLFLSQEF